MLLTMNRIKNVGVFFKAHPKFSFGLALLILAAGGIWWFFHRSGETTPRFQTTQAERGSLIVSVTAAGSVDTTNSRAVTTTTSGVVSKVHVKNGQAVRSGEALFTVELDADGQLAYTQASSSYQSAKNGLTSAENALYSLQSAMLGKWDAYKELAESEYYKDENSDRRNLPEFMIAKDDWLSTEAVYKQQQAVIAAAKTSVSSASQGLRNASPTIYAPIGGTVTGLSLQAGSVITGGGDSQTIAYITTDAPPTITITLTESDVAKVKEGSKATITVDSITDKTFTGTVISVDTVGSVSSGVVSYPAVVAFDTKPEGVLSNMSAEVSVITESKTDVLVVPSNAVVQQNEVSYVRTFDENGELSLIEVTTGITSDTQTEITSGLEEGTEIVIITATTTTTQTGTNRTGQGNVMLFGSGVGGGFTSGPPAGMQGSR